MSKKHLALVALVAAATAAACEKTPSEPITTDVIALQQTDKGNGFPSGAHYNLNIIGVQNEKTAEMEANNPNGIGNRIFVMLYFDDGDNTGECWEGNCPVDMKVTDRRNKILLQEGDDFAVLDANATDRDGALFQLPFDVVDNYDVYARPLGKSGNDIWARMTTCGTVLVDPDGVAASGDEYEEVVCSTSSKTFERPKGGAGKAEKVNDYLFYIDGVTVDPDDTDAFTQCMINEGEVTNTAEDDPAVTLNDLPLFHNCFEGFFWDYDNHGLKLLQLRFYAK